jgi:hypothetical protein
VISKLRCCKINHESRRESDSGRSDSYSGNYSNNSYSNSYSNNSYSNNSYGGYGSAPASNSFVELDDGDGELPF